MEFSKQQFMNHAQIYDAWEKDSELGAIILWDDTAINMSVKTTTCPVCGGMNRTFQFTKIKGNTVEILHSETQGCMGTFSPYVKWVITTIYSYLGRKLTMVHYSENYAKRGN